MSYYWDIIWTYFWNPNLPSIGIFFIKLARAKIHRALKTSQMEKVEKNEKNVALVPRPPFLSLSLLRCGFRPAYQMKKGR